MSESERALKEAMDRLQGEYRVRYAGKPRVTRDPGPIRRLAAEGRSLVERARLQVPPPQSELLRELEERAERYEAEAKEVAKARSQAGESGVETAMLARRANQYFAMYGRHFAGKPRTNRDLERLSEILDGLDAVERAMVAAGPANERNLEIVRERAMAFREEVREIERARDAVAPEDRAGMLGGRANVLFEVWDRQFAGLPRLGRNPERLEALVRGLREVREHMRRLPEPQTPDSAQVRGRNQDVVEERLALFEQELAAVREARQTTSFEALIQAIETERDTVMGVWDSEYAGQSRATRDLPRLESLCDRLADVEEQFEKLIRRFKLPELESSLSLTRDLRDMLEEETVEVRKAQGGAQ